MNAPIRSQTKADQLIRDGDWILFEYDPVMDRSVWVLDAGDEWIIRTDYHNADRLKTENAAAEAETHGRRFGDYVRVASVPHNEFRAAGLDRALREGSDKYVSRWLNDSDNRGYRTSRGKF